MNKISNLVSILFLLLFVISIAFYIDDKVPFISVFIAPLYYLILYLTLKIFIWDKRKQFNLTLVGNNFRENDIIMISNQITAIIIKSFPFSNGTSKLSCFRYTESKYWLINWVSIKFIRIGYKLRSFIK